MEWELSRRFWKSMNFFMTNVSNVSSLVMCSVLSVCSHWRLTDLLCPPVNLLAMYNRASKAEGFIVNIGLHSTGTLPVISIMAAAFALVKGRGF
jgi:hypothetical protein